jgi:hypothetical protein
MTTILEKFLTELERGVGGEVKVITRTASTVKNRTLTLKLGNETTERLITTGSQ